ncbi:hypothetical protein ACFU9B_39485 [Streptomyces sp. NPDC057592]|uniref:hypothetical protein n=1 Tax=unclassified Streptomyces TaxID=2593676 RepID=UPI0036BD66B3
MDSRARRRVGATPEVGDTHAGITAAYVDRPVQAVAQALLVHGVAAACLAAVGSGVLSRARRSGNVTARLAGWAGIAAAALASGIGSLFLSTALAQAAFISLPLLLL